MGTTLRQPISVLACGLALGCGSRSSLADFEGASGAPGSNPVDSEGCTPGLQPDAAAPISGYCSDRAGRAIHELPDAASIVGSAPTKSVYGHEPVVDRLGRVHVAIDTDDTDSAVLADTLIGVDEDGSTAFSLPFDGTIGRLAVVADGTLRVTSTEWKNGVIQRNVSLVSRNGKLLERHSLPEGAGFDFAVSPEGNLVFTPSGNEDDGRVVATTTRGELLWKSEPLHGYASPAAISRDGRVVVTASRFKQVEVVALDGATGNVLWRYDDVGWGGPPAIATDGSVRVPLGSPDLSTEELLAIEPDGSLRFRTLLPGEAVTTGEKTCVDVQGRSYVRTREGLVGVAKDGPVLFSRYAHPNGIFACATDPTGTVLSASLGFEAIDPQTGDAIWTLDGGFPGSPPGTIYYSGPVVVAGHHRLVLMDHGGTLHWLGD